MSQQAVTYRLSDDYWVRPLVEADIDGPYPTWFADPEVCRWNSHGKFFRSREWFLEFVRGANGSDRIVWAICHAEHGHVGNISLTALSFVNRNAEFAILVGDRRHWGRGVGKLAGRALLRHGFGPLNLHRIHCGTAASNLGMQGLAKALHMREEGRRRQHLWLEGEWVDVLEYGVLRDEFLAAEAA